MTGAVEVRLVIALVLAACVHASAADAITECSATRGADAAHWAWREINGKRCWYRGEPGRSKSLLRWVAPLLNAETGRPEIGSAPSNAAAPEPRADPVVEPQPTEEPEWQATMEDQLLAFTCCWPELEPSLVLNKMMDRVSELPSASLPSKPLWPFMLLMVGLLTGSILLAKRRLT